MQSASFSSDPLQNMSPLITVWLLPTSCVAREAVLIVTLKIMDTKACHTQRTSILSKLSAHYCSMAVVPIISTHIYKLLLHTDLHPPIIGSMTSHQAYILLTTCWNRWESIIVLSNTFLHISVTAHHIVYYDTALLYVLPIIRLFIMVPLILKLI